MQSSDITKIETLSEQHDAIDTALKVDNHSQVIDILDELTNSEIGDILESFPLQKREIIWSLVNPEREGEILVHVNDEVRVSLIRDMNNQQLVAATESLDIDDLADIMDDLPDKVAAKLLTTMDRKNREQLTKVMSYPEDTAGGLMDPKVVTIRADVTLEVVLRYLRLLGELPEVVDDFFVVDRYDHYVGRLSLACLLTKPTETLVLDLINNDLPAIPITMVAAQVASEFEHHDMVSAPVLDDEGRLAGRITIDDVVDVIREEAEHSVLSMAGLDEDDDMFAPVVKSSCRRMIWLGVNLLTAFIAAAVIGLYEATLEKVVALAILMPVVASMGGIAGTQTLALMIRGMATGQIGSANSKALLRKEMAVGLFNGVIWALVVSLLAYFWFADWAISWIFGLALLINLLVAAFAGVIVPFVLKKIAIDPALAGGVVLTTVTDVVGFMTFLGLGTWFLL